MGWFAWLKRNQSSPGNQSDRKEKKNNGITFGLLNWLSISLLAAGVIIVLLFGASASGKATIFQWMMASLLSGAFIGFLFGIPRVIQGNQSSSPGNPVQGGQPGTAAASTKESQSGTTYQQQVNTNLTEISDWLTKIIVGLGLVNLTKIPPHLAAIAKILADALTGCPKQDCTALAYGFAYGLIITYSILGFLIGYIATRLYLAGAFSDADRKALSLLASRTEENAAAVRSANQKADFALAIPMTGTSAPAPSRAPGATEKLAGEAFTVPSPEENMEVLIQEYNRIRKDMPSGDLRTSRMTDVFGRMTSMANSLSAFDIPGSLKAADGGRRLAAYACLYAKPDYDRVEVLIDTLISEPTPFGQYWAILTLGRILAVGVNQRLSNPTLKKLKDYYDQLQPGVDRKYELGKIMPEFLR